MKIKSNRKTVLILSVGVGVLILLGITIFLILPLLKAQSTQSSTPPKENTVSYQGKNITFIQKTEVSAGLFFSLKEKPFSSDQLTKIRNTLNQEGIRTLSDGKLKYWYNTDFFGASFPQTKEEAISQVKKILDSFGLLPKDNYLTTACSASVSSMDPKDGTMGTAVISSWTVKFYQTYHGIPMVSQEDENGISVMFWAEGTVNLEYHWMDVVPAAQTMPEDRTLLTADEAIQTYLGSTGFAHVFEIYQTRTFPEIYFHQIYIYQNNQPVSCWVFCEDDAFLNPVYLDAYTGKQLF